jgi:protein-tyrosine phosphatase
MVMYLTIGQEGFLVNVLFVCLGNICRSPSAEGVFRDLVEREGLAHTITMDSAGTAAYHVGQPPDSRAQSTARGRGIDLSGLSARQAKADDFNTFDYVIAMDHDNHNELLSICPFGQEGRLHMFLRFAPGINHAEVPDPYYGDAGFDVVLDMLEEASRGLLGHIREHDLA